MLDLPVFCDRSRVRRESITKLFKGHRVRVRVKRLRSVLKFERNKRQNLMLVGTASALMNDFWNISLAL